MLLKPEYAQNIIVGVKTSSQFSWYLTERDVWILDIVKYKKLYERNGFSFDMDFALSLRNNISVVNEKNYRLYLQEYTDYLVPSSELKKLVEHHDYGSTILELRPSLFIDFNQKSFSLFILSYYLLKIMFLIIGQGFVMILLVIFLKRIDTGFLIILIT
ncbi:hypothetical protein [Niallia circulans]|uniref:hypothetical protein n=1 Tax=Niallia circulans TaxID=1397 RepID=UPI00201DC1B6|nr:hypothetical protein [Niallia circulans]